MTVVPVSGHRRGPLLVGIALVLLTGLSLGRIVTNDFIGMDDESYLTNNEQVLQGLTLRGTAWAFTSTERSNWHPLTWLSHQMDVSLFGLNPAGHHFVSLALHTANALLVFSALRALSGTLWRPAAVAALFALHPLHVESVAWAAERKDVLSTLLMLLALAAWLRQVRRRLGVSVPSAALFAAALLAKPMPVTFPFLLLVLDWWPLGRWAPGGIGPPGAMPARYGLLPPLTLVCEKTVLFLLSAASCVVTYTIQSDSGAMSTARAVPGAVRVASALVSYVRYLVKALWPVDLAIYYPFTTRILWWQWAGALLGLLVVTVLLFRSSRRAPWWVAGWLWYLGTLVPVIGFVQVGGQSLADRYTYFPLVGLFLCVIWAAGERSRRGGYAGGLITLTVGAVVVLMGYLAFVQAGRWRNSETVFRHALTVSPGSWLILNNLGTTLAAQDRLVEAERVYRDALQAEPFRALLHNNLGRTLAREGRLAEAEHYYRWALRIDPRFAQAHDNLGALLVERGRFNEALTQFEAAARSGSGAADAQMRLGGALLKLGRPREAVIQLRLAAGMHPGDAALWTLLGDALASAGDTAAAAKAYREALRLDPAHPLARGRLGELQSDGVRPSR